ncbi:hypothetical protein E2C01_055493 [Portunus trituberculatus]|uniref:Uncharacterized protein n=1 Tax=Portunus trituberculatus TaxID=210409 RepID=A0A5B7GMV8_PORTR|nr:hypothetical protein [Portunus trituberculatus]
MSTWCSADPDSSAIFHLPSPPAATPLPEYPSFFEGGGGRRWTGHHSTSKTCESL